MPQNSEKFVTLAEGPNGGLTIPIEAYKLIFALSDRGLTLRQEGDRLRVAGPDGSKPDLSTEDVAAITKWKIHLLALLSYEAPEISCKP